MSIALPAHTMLHAAVNQRCCWRRMVA